MPADSSEVPLVPRESEGLRHFSVLDLLEYFLLLKADKGMSFCFILQQNFRELLLLL